MKDHWKTCFLTFETYVKLLTSLNWVNGFYNHYQPPCIIINIVFMNASLFSIIAATITIVSVAPI